MSDINYIKKLLIIFDKNFLSIIPLILLFLMSTAIDVLSIAIIAPYISFLLDPNSPSFLNSILMNISIMNLNFDNLLIIFSLFIIFIFFLKFIFALIVRFAIKRYSLKCRHGLQMRLLDSYQSMDYSNYSQRNSSEFIKNVRELSSDCVTTLDSSLRIISELIVFTAVIIYLFLTQPFVVLSLLCLILIFVSIHNYTLKPKTIQYGKNKIEALNYIYQAVDEGLKGFKEIKILNKENYFKKMQKIGLDKVYENELKSELILFYPRYLYELVIVVFIISFVSYKINIGFVSADIIPLVGTFAVASLRMIPSISVVSSGLIMVQLTYFAIDIIFKDILSLNNNKNSSFNSNNDNFNEKINSIELKNIKFRYPNSSDYIFDNLNLKIKKNTCIGITGENGSGKSTLVDIMLGLLKPESGKILVNGIEHENFKTIAKKMGYIPQDHLIISDKISKNISLEYNEKLINLEKLDKAIHSANLKKVISDHSGGANTLIGNDGVRLSGGEYKKIALARMFYHDKDVLIMDEATNSLDKESEEIIIAEMERIKRSKTVIIISHNIKTLSVCDLIFKIDNKKINEK